MIWFFFLCSWALQAESHLISSFAYSLTSQDLTSPPSLTSIIPSPFIVLVTLLRPFNPWALFLTTPSLHGTPHGHPNRATSHEPSSHHEARAADACSGAERRLSRATAGYANERAPSSPPFRPLFVLVGLRSECAISAGVRHGQNEAASRNAAYLASWHCQRPRRDFWSA